MKVVIIEGHSFMKRGLVSVISSQPDINIIGEASTIEEGLSLLTKKPDLVLLNLWLKDDCSVDIVKKAYEQELDCKFIIVNSPVKEGFFKKLKKIGVDGYVLNDALPEELLYAIKVVSKGRQYYDPRILDLIIEQREDTNEDLTMREQEVLAYIAKGFSNREIAKKLYITEHTVKKHASRIFEKLGVSDRIQAAMYVNSKKIVI